MHTLDSRSRNFGILALRHEGFDTQSGYDESNVIGVLAKNVTGRQAPVAGGRFIDNKRSIGNLMPAFLWPKNTRPAPGHNWIWPAIVSGEQETPSVPSKVTATLGGGGGALRSGGTVNSGTQLAGNPYSSRVQPQTEPQRGKTTALPADSITTMLPVKTSAMYPDTRFSPVGYATPLDPNGGGAMWPLFPKGYYGLALPATDEAQQVNLFFPCDPRLIAVNNGDEPAMGSMVCDTDENEAIDPERIARLQSAFRVIRSPYNSTANAIALQLSRSENEDCSGGLMIDHDMGDVIGCVSVIHDGPFDVGDARDRHGMGTDGDGNSMNPMHISVQALFKDKVVRDIDGPIMHEGYWKGAQKFPFSSFVHWEYDPAIGKHRFRADVPIYVPNITTPPTETPPPPTTDGPPPPPPTDTPTEPGTPNIPMIPWDVDRSIGGGGPAPAGGAPAIPPPNINPLPPTPGTPGAPIPGGGPVPVPPGGPPGGRMPVGPIPAGGAGFGGWLINGRDFWGGLFGIIAGKNGNAKKQAERAAKAAAKAARRAARKAKKQKPKRAGVRFKKPPVAPGNELKIPGVNVPEPWRHGPGPKFEGIKQFSYLPPAIPVTLSPNFHPENPGNSGGGGGGGGPTPTTSIPSPGTSITPPGRPAPPSGGLPGPQTPPAMVNEFMFPSWIARPQSYSLLAPDLRYDPAPNMIDVATHDRFTPVTGHIQAYGPQGGVVGSNPQMSGPRGWLYTTRPRVGRWWPGSANGGYWGTTPETDLADMNTRLNPQNVIQSETYFGMAPRVYFGVGLPDLSRGGMFLGYRWGADRSGNATFDRMDESGLPTQIVELGADGIVSILPRGSSSGQGGQLSLRSPGGINSVSIQAPDSAESDLVFVMPDTDPTAGQVLSGAAPVGGVVALSWASAGGNPTMQALFGQSVDVTIAGTGTETTMLGAGAGSLIVPAGTFDEGVSLHEKLRGVMSTVAVPGAINIRAKLDGATNLDAGGTPVANLAGRPWTMDIILTCQDMTDPAAAVFSGSIVFTIVNATQTFTIGDGTFAGTIDTTVDNTIDVTFDWTTADAGNSITTNVAKVDLESP